MKLLSKEGYTKTYKKTYKVKDSDQSVKQSAQSVPSILSLGWLSLTTHSVPSRAGGAGGQTAWLLGLV